MNHFISYTLQIKDPNIRIDPNHVEEKEFKGRQSLFYYGLLTYIPEACTCCGCIYQEHSIVNHGTRSSRITLPPVSGLPAYLILKKQRFLCRHCQKTFTATSSIIDKHCFIANRVKHLIMDRAVRVTSEKEIAQDFSVSVHTVRRIINQTALSLSPRPTTGLPTHLCFDEFKSVATAKGAMSFICCDALSHQLVDVVEDRRKGSLGAYFSRFNVQDRRQVKTITMDMYEPYMDIAQRWFPQAKVVIDPFHLVQAINRELNRCRVQFMNRIRYKDSRLYNKLKRYWKLILVKREQLRSYPYQRYPLFDWWTHTQGIVSYLLEKDPVLKDTYEIVHSLREALQTRNWMQYHTLLVLAKTKQISKGLKRVLRSFKKYDEYIENTFRYKNFTNGPIEGLNNKIKVLKRNAYGYRNYSHFRARILLMCRLYQPQSKKDQATKVA